MNVFYCPFFSISVVDFVKKNKINHLDDVKPEIKLNLISVLIL